jgi:hypothetical protein
MKDNGGIKDISNEQRELIATSMVQCGAATDPSQMAVMTNTYFAHVLGGLVGKYGYALRGLDADIQNKLKDDFETIVQDGNEYCVFEGTDIPVPPDNIQYMINTAYQMLQASKWHWGTAQPLLQRAQRELIKICVAEQLLDYTVAYVSMLDEMKQLREISGKTDEREPTEKPFSV